MLLCAPSSKNQEIFDIFKQLLAWYGWVKLAFGSPTHYEKSVRILSFSGLYFLASGLNTDKKNSEDGHLLRRVRCFTICIKIILNET